MDVNMHTDGRGTAEATPPPHSGNGHGPLPGGEPNPAAQAWRDAPVFLKELKSYAQYFFSAKVDGAKAKTHQLIVYAVWGVVGGLMAMGIVFAAVFLVLASLAAGLGRLFGSQAWLGGLIVGVLVLGAIVLSVKVVLSKMTKAWRLQTEQKYERKQTEQRERFGHDVHDRASGAGNFRA